MRSILTKDTLLPAGVVVGLLTLTFVFGTNYERINQTLEHHEVRFNNIDQKLTENTAAIVDLRKALVPPDASAMSVEPPAESETAPRRYYYSCSASAPAGWRVDSKCRLYKL